MKKVIVYLTIFVCIAIILVASAYKTSTIEGFEYTILKESDVVKPLTTGNVPLGYYEIQPNATGGRQMAPFPNGSELSPLPISNTPPEGYYFVNQTIPSSSPNVPATIKTFMAKIPSGYKRDANDIYKIVPLTQRAQYADTANRDAPNIFTDASANPKYDPTNLDASYNIGVPQSRFYDSSDQYMTVYDPSQQKMVMIPFRAAQNSPLYYQPGSMKYGVSNYVPMYDDSVYLSKLTNTYTFSNAYPTDHPNGGFCDTYGHDSAKREEKCGTLASDVCASTSCCVLLGGKKCVAGDESGPTLKANYSDPFINNKDYYYHQGKCYGNCLL